MKFFRILIAVLLLPFCVGALQALWQIIIKSGSAHTIWLVTLAGAITWVVIYYFLPTPRLVYVFGHEWTHALGTWLFGGSVKRIKVTSRGGHVLSDKANFITTLAPYFFPFYVVLLVLLFAIGNFFFDWSAYILWFYFFIGMMYAFHVTLTTYILKIEQTDISGEGYLFSWVIILLGNVLVLLIGIPLLTNKVSVSFAMHSWINDSLLLYEKIRNLF